MHEFWVVIGSIFGTFAILGGGLCCILFGGWLGGVFVKIGAWRRRRKWEKAPPQRLLIAQPQAIIIPQILSASELLADAIDAIREQQISAANETTPRQSDYRLLDMEF